jgi:hypothetical protein
MDRDTANGCRQPDGAPGHYESWFNRANHPTKPLAFWIRYTIFAPKNRPDDAIGEVWAMFFDGEKGTINAVKEVFPLHTCSFARHGIDVQIGDCTLNGSAMKGQAALHGSNMSWELNYTSPEPPLLFFKPWMYKGGFPKAKALVGSPLSIWTGKVRSDGQEIDIDGWIGSQNHNWGIKHTDQYAWGQVAGFDDAPNSFLEVSTARIKLGPFWTPWFTLMVLRHEGQEYRLNSLRGAVRAKGSYEFFDWNFDAKRKGLRIQGGITATPQQFVGLPYGNPPGGVKTCLNSKIAACRITLTRPDGSEVRLATKNRAAFEILTERTDHGVRVLDAPLRVG